MRRPRHIISSVAFAAVVSMSALSTTSPAAAQMPNLPPGVSVADLVSAPVSVPAGQTTTVDIGVPVSVNHSANGWTVVSAGTSVSVTAPANSGATVAVPVSAAGQSATITLVAEGSVAAPIQEPEVDAEAEPVQPSTGGPARESTEKSAETPGAPGVPGEASNVVPRPERQSAASMNQDDAERIDLESSIEGNVLTASLGLRQALSLFNQFRDVSQDGLQLRYLDSEGQIIQGVTREIDELARTLTLTYPEGETPDNPFIMEVIRDGTTTVALVTLTDPSAPRTSSPEQVEGEPEFESAETADSLAIGGVLLGIIALVIVVAAIAFWIKRRRR